MITLVDYGLGNIQAFANIYKRLNIPCRYAKTAADLTGSQKVILPGVGAFDWAMQRLMASGMCETLDSLVQEKAVPVLGVCVGMQMMARSSEEGESRGLGWIPGEVKRFDETAFKTKTHLPHMGWNDIDNVDHPLFAGLVAPRFYFLHSYYFAPDSPDQTLATTDYSVRFSSVVYSRHIFGVQFHPEKSHDWGARLLKNFAEL